jgi:hypothetical protein
VKQGSRFKGSRVQGFKVQRFRVQRFRGSVFKVLLSNCTNPDKPEPEKLNHERAKTRKKARLISCFQILCFRDDPPEADFIKCKEITTKILKPLFADALSL